MAIRTTVSTAERILAIDLGKYKSVECRYDASSGEVAFASFDTTRSELVKRLTRHRPDVAVIKACALSGWVYAVRRVADSLSRGQHGERSLEVQTQQTQDRP